MIPGWSAWLMRGPSCPRRSGPASWRWSRPHREVNQIGGQKLSGANDRRPGVSPGRAWGLRGDDRHACKSAATGSDACRRAWCQSQLARVSLMHRRCVHAPQYVGCNAEMRAADRTPGSAPMRACSTTQRSAPRVFHPPETAWQFAVLLRAIWQSAGVRRVFVRCLAIGAWQIARLGFWTRNPTSDRLTVPGDNIARGENQRVKPASQANV